MQCCSSCSTLALLTHAQNAYAVATAFARVYHILRMQDEESYVYLAAVQGLSVLADVSPSYVIPKLVALFCGTSPGDAAGTVPMAQCVKGAVSVAQCVRQLLRRC
jgi:Required for nuclear transport of RNA pol II C-terminus 1